MSKTIGKSRRKAAILARYKVVFSEDAAEGAQGILPNYTLGTQRHQEVASMFSIDLSNYVATRCANCFRKCITKRPRRFALHSRDQMRRLPYLSVTIPTCWFALSWSWFAPQKMLRRCRLRPVMERAGHHEVASMFSLDLSNYVATRCTNCFGKCITKRPRRFALHSRDQMRRLPYLSVTIPTCWFALSWSWFAPQKMLKRCRLRPVMERAGHHEVNSMFSTDLSNNVAKLLRKLFREVYHQASEALRAAFPRPDEEAFPARRWGDISHTQTKPCRNGTSEEPSSNSSERAHRIAFFHPDEEAWNSEEPAQKCVGKSIEKMLLTSRRGVANGGLREGFVSYCINSTGNGLPVPIFQTASNARFNRFWGEVPSRSWTWTWSWENSSAEDRPEYPFYEDDLPGPGENWSPEDMPAWMFTRLTWRIHSSCLSGHASMRMYYNTREIMRGASLICRRSQFHGRRARTWLWTFQMYMIIPAVYGIARIWTYGHAWKLDRWFLRPSVAVLVVNVVSRRSTLKQHLAPKHRGLQQQEPNRWGRIAPEIS